MTQNTPQGDIRTGNRKMEFKEFRRKRIGAGLEPVLGLVLLEAVPAIDGPALCRFEWNLGLSSAIGTCYIVHLAWGPIVVSRAAVAARALFVIHYILPILF